MYTKRYFEKLSCCSKQQIIFITSSRQNKKVLQGSYIGFAYTQTFATKGDVTLVTGRFATTIFNATQRCDVGTMFELFKTMSQQCCNAMLR